jgi:AraC-like DNA-binding protein
MDILGLIQGITLGILLLILNYRHYRSTFFLGLFLLLFSLKLAVFIPKGLNLDQVYPEFLLLPFNFSWLLFPLFFIYTQKVSIFSNQKTKYWVIVPGIISFLLQVIIYFLPFSTKLEIAESFWYELFFTFIGICYSWAIGIWNLWLIYYHKKEVQNTFSLIEFKELEWARIFLIYAITTSVIIHILYIISPQNYYFKLLFSIFDLLAIYWIAGNGIIQRNVLSTLKNEPSPNFPEVKSIVENYNQIYAIEDLRALMNQIEDYVVSTESFMSAELTIIDLAEKLKEHPKRISTAINTILNKNFNTYINQHRIKKAERLLKNKSLDNFSIEGIGKEVGFNSKSAFYSAFKKMTGMTPTAYKERTAA